MTACTYNCFMNVINIGNSIIGVSILAMPYCFRKCGIFLSIILILLSGFFTRLACYLLLKSAIIARRRNFEFLAFHIFGASGKLAVEISVIGFLIGVCIAFFVVIGDLGPPLAAEFLAIENSSHLRTNVLMLVGLCVALPLGMLRKIDSLTSLSALSIAFYACLILKIFAEAVPNLAGNEWWYQVNWWQSDGILPCLPIFSMALSCQTQLFEFFDTMNDTSIKRMQSVVGGAVCLCSVVYIMVGALGYIAFHDKVITGNVLVFLTPSPVTEVIKFCFILTVAVSFPLCLFPCRSSLHSLLFKQGFGHHETTIPEFRFRILTISLVIVTIGIAIMLPNIEFVLGIIGSTIGTLICLIFPALMFIKDTSKNTTEKRMAQILMGIGAFILLACTYSTLHEASTTSMPSTPNEKKNLLAITPELPKLVLSSVPPEEVHSPYIPAADGKKFTPEKKKEKPPDVNLLNDQKRLEPPIPQEPDAKVAPQSDLDPQALQKEDKELQKDTAKPSPPAVTPKPVNTAETNNVAKQEDILRKLEEQHREQKLILEQQKQVLEELKHHQEIHEEFKAKFKEIDNEEGRAESASKIEKNFSRSATDDPKLDLKMVVKNVREEKDPKIGGNQVKAIKNALSNNIPKDFDLNVANHPEVSDHKNVLSNEFQVKVDSVVINTPKMNDQNVIIDADPNFVQENSKDALRNKEYNVINEEEGNIGKALPLKVIIESPDQKEKSRLAENINVDSNMPYKEVPKIHESFVNNQSKIEGLQSQMDKERSLNTKKNTKLNVPNTVVTPGLSVQHNIQNVEAHINKRESLGHEKFVTPLRVNEVNIDSGILGG